MKIAVAALGKKQSSKLGDQAGRAPFYLIFDEKGTLLETLKNPFSIGGGGAGFGVAKMLADRQVTVAIAGEFGQKMISALEERGLRAYKSRGTALEALAELNEQGKL